MRAIIIATGHGPGVAPLDARYAVPMLPLVDRPFLQHVVEFFAAQGVKRFDFVRCHLPEQLERHLGNGERWGSRFTYHLVRDPERPYHLLKTLDWSGAEQETILLGHGDRLPAVSLEGLGPEAASRPVLFYQRPKENFDRVWTGWALLSHQHVASLPADADEAMLWEHLQRVSSEPRWVEVAGKLDTATLGTMMESHRAVLDKKFHGLMLAGQEIEPGIWLSRNVVLHPTAKITPPVYVGENCQIGPGVKLGPLAVIGNDCMLDSHCTVHDSLTYPGSYIGEGLELADVIVDRNHLINVRVGGAVTVDDIFILGNLADRQLRRGAQRVASQLAGALLLVLLSPLLLLVALALKLGRRGPVFSRKTVVRVPASAKTAHWRTYSLLSFWPPAATPPLGLRHALFQLLPALINIARGDLGFVGLPPRTAAEIRRLPADWQTLHLASKAGVITEAALQCGPNATADDLFMAEAFYAAAANWRYDLRLLFRYLGRVVRP